MEKIQNTQYEKFTAFEVSQILGEPRDARVNNGFDQIITMVSEVASAEPTDYVYYHVARIPVDKVVNITSTGYVVQENISLIAPTAFTFIDMASNEQYVKFVDLAKRKEDVLARVNQSIDFGLNSWELYYLLGLMATACASTGNQVTLDTAEVRFSFEHAVEMIQKVVDYGDNYVLLMGANVDADVKMWEFNDNKFMSTLAQLERLGVKRVRVPAFSVTVDGTPTAIIDPNKAYLVALNSNSAMAQKPCLFVRRKLGEIAELTGVLSADGKVPERLILTTGNPVPVGATNQRMLAVAVNGYEELVAAITNPYAICEFERVQP